MMIITIVAMMCRFIVRNIKFVDAYKQGTYTINSGTWGKQCAIPRVSGTRLLVMSACIYSELCSLKMDFVVYTIGLLGSLLL